ncbi:hypothetical protein QBC37DRAFT_478911 [Rhypophila decipiens]|uniref:Uncharacterized protein n=1 Tax=Rhypophila decipiens TaxID=261697 RepID=A0AAN6YH96_9PEZI|nr:hypothetical protein QBC37DRAFT_478911 [Rhypophila decipiens]
MLPYMRRRVCNQRTSLSLLDSNSLPGSAHTVGKSMVRRSCGWCWPCRHILRDGFVKMGIREHGVVGYASQERTMPWHPTRVGHTRLAGVNSFSPPTETVPPPGGSSILGRVECIFYLSPRCLRKTLHLAGSTALGNLIKLLRNCALDDLPFFRCDPPNHQYRHILLEKGPKVPLGRLEPLIPKIQHPKPDPSMLSQKINHLLRVLIFDLLERYDSRGGCGVATRGEIFLKTVIRINYNPGVKGE